MFVGCLVAAWLQPCTAGTANWVVGGLVCAIVVFILGNAWPLSLSPCKTPPQMQPALALYLSSLTATACGVAKPGGGTRNPEAAHLALI